MNVSGRRPALILAAWSLVAATAASDEPRPGAVLRAAEIDFASLAPLTRSAMQEELGLVLRPASLVLSWRQSRPAGETARDELRVVFLRSSGFGADRGTSALGSTARRGPVPTIWVYVPNVALALGLDPDAVPTSLEAQRLVGVALGRVVAHEVVHALAPDVEHAEAGVMRPRLHAFHLASGRPALESQCAEALAVGARAWLTRGGLLWRSGPTRAGSSGSGRLDDSLAEY